SLLAKTPTTPSLRRPPPPPPRHTGRTHHHRPGIRPATCRRDTSRVSSRRPATRPPRRRPPATRRSLTPCRRRRPLLIRCRPLLPAIPLRRQSPPRPPRLPPPDRAAWRRLDRWLCHARTTWCAGFI